MNFINQMVIPSFLFLVTVGFGFWVSKLGKPYNGLLFNIHKLIALGAAILATVGIIRMDPLTEFPLRVIVLISIAVVCVISMFLTGAVMSIKEKESRLVLSIHQAAPVLITITMGWAVYLLK